VVSYRSWNKTVYSAKYHLMWCPKYRRGVVAGAVEERLTEILGRVAEGVGAEILGVEVVPDHVLLVVVIAPVVALWEFMPLAKGRSSRLLRAEFVALHRLAWWWSPSWLGSPVGGAPLEVVRGDVENQKQAA
jgi:REP-associated tyrosine transposase